MGFEKIWLKNRLNYFYIRQNNKNKININKHMETIIIILRKIKN